MDGVGGSSGDFGSVGGDFGSVGIDFGSVISSAGCQCSFTGSDHDANGSAVGSFTGSVVIGTGETKSSIVGCAFSVNSSFVSGAGIFTGDVSSVDFANGDFGSGFEVCGLMCHDDGVLWSMGCGVFAGEPLASLGSILSRCQPPVNHKRFYSERKIDRRRL
jgi:hypothetical protein